MPAPVVLDPDRSVVEQLRERVAAMQGGPARLAMPTTRETSRPARPSHHEQPEQPDQSGSRPEQPPLSELLRLHAGATYGVDSASLALALAAGPSQAGEWVGFAGWGDFGAEAAADLGVDLTRTVLVPDPGEHWLEVTAALVDVLRVVVLRPPATVDARAAGVLESRLRRRSTALVVWGGWPRCSARLSLEQTRWAGPERGQGRLRSRRARLAVRRGSAPPVRADVWFPGEMVALGPVQDTERRFEETPPMQALG